MNDLPDDMLIEIFNQLPIYYIPYICNKRLYNLANNYNYFNLFKKQLSTMSCGDRMSTFIRNQQLLIMGKNYQQYNFKNVISTHCGDKHCVVWTKDYLHELNNNIDSHNTSNILCENSYDILGIASGDYHTVILKKNGLYGYGMNSYGQLGIENLYHIKKITPILSSVKDDLTISDGLSIVNKIIKIACGGAHTVIMTKNKVYGMGCNNYYQLGLNDNHLKLLYEADFIDVSCGHQCTVMLTTYGVYGLGSNMNSELGLGNDNYIKIPTKIPIDNVVSVKNGMYFTLFLTESNELYGCGDNYYGQLGTKHNLNIRIPIKITLHSVYNFTCGSYHTIINNYKNYYGCGWNKHDQLGLGKYKAVKYNKFKKLNL